MFNTIYCHSSEDMHELPDESVHLVVTSPPYNVGMEYEDVIDFDEYREGLRRIWKECYRVLTNDGRLCVNVSSVGYKPYIPLHFYIGLDILSIGLQMMGEIVWQQNVPAAKYRARGTWWSAKCPVIAERHEYVLVFCKHEYSRIIDGESTISKDEFRKATESIWEIKEESAKRIGHPAPFPLGLPRRLIQLYSFKDDVVLDPFMGSGTTALAAKETGRRWVGYDTSEKYVDLATGRLRQEMLFT